MKKLLPPVLVTLSLLSCKPRSYNESEAKWVSPTYGDLLMWIEGDNVYEGKCSGGGDPKHCGNYKKVAKITAFKKLLNEKLQRDISAVAVERELAQKAELVKRIQTNETFLKNNNHKDLPQNILIKTITTDKSNLEKLNSKIEIKKQRLSALKKRSSKLDDALKLLKVPIRIWVEGIEGEVNDDVYYYAQYFSSAFFEASSLIRTATISKNELDEMCKKEVQYMNAYAVYGPKSNWSCEGGKYDGVLSEETILVRCASKTSVPAHSFKEENNTVICLR